MMALSSRPTAIQSGGVVLAHPSGNQFFRHLAATLRDAGMLAELCTGIDWPGGWLQRILPCALTRELTRRTFSETLGLPVRQHPWREALRLAADRMGLRRLTRRESGLLSVDAVYRSFDAWVASRLPRIRRASVAYAYEDAAEATFRAARELGWRTVYDLPIAYWRTSRRLLDEEAARWPVWEPTLVGTRDSDEKLARKTREIELADLVVCPSRFVSESVPGELVTGKTVIVAPFGSPTGQGADVSRGGHGPLRVLFAGAMTQRKGLADLFAAFRMLKRSDVELVVMGSPVVELDFYRRQGVPFVYEPPRPHAAVLALMGTCDVLCLPSIVEGRALVVQEAMSVGLPVIVTPHTGTDDVVEDGSNGFIVPIRAPETIAARIDWLAGNRAALRGLSVQARLAARRFSWTRYGDLVVEALGRLPATG